MRNFRPMLSPRFAQMRLLENDRAGASAELRGSLCERRASKYIFTLIAALICGAVLFPTAGWAQTVTATLGTGTNPTAVAVNPVTNKIYFANFGSNNVTVIDRATNGTATVSAGSNPMAVAVNAVTNKIYVANSGSNNVTVIDGATNTTTNVTAGTEPRAIAVNPVTNKISTSPTGAAT